MFVDQVRIFVKGGDGGNGCVSFRREAHVPRGGPDGGYGGKGGDVVLVALSHQNTLLPLRYEPEHRADRGGHGGPGNRTGRDGAHREVAVPPGTSVRDAASSEPVGELLRDGDRLVVVRPGAQVRVWMSVDGHDWRSLTSTGEPPGDAAAEVTVLPGGVLVRDGTATWLGAVVNEP